MDWICQRYSDDSNSTLGLLFKVINVAVKDKNHFFCFTLEDEGRDVKVMHETRIPAGRYPLKIRKEDTPLTIKHRVRYNKGYKIPWFDFHIELSNVPNFTGIYIHEGYNDDWTSGCLLLGFQASKVNGRQSLSLSLEAVKAFYTEVYDLIEKGEEVFLTIRDER